MTKSLLKNFLTAMLLTSSMVLAQDEGDVDAIEKARQAKEAAEKAAAEASAATEAAIEAAASRAAKGARADAKRKKEEEEARKIAEAKAAEEAELDAAASAAAEEAKRKMAEELGLEYESPETELAEGDTTVSDSTAEEFVAKEPLGINVGLTGSVGFVNGAYLTNNPTGASLVITTPIGFKLGSLDFQVSVALGSYSGQSNNGSFNPLVAGVGGNLTLAQFIFYEGHVGLIGSGLGGRGFGGVSLERLMKKGLNLPVNILIGAEGFLSTKPDENAVDPVSEENTASYWGGLGIRLDYNF